MSKDTKQYIADKEIVKIDWAVVEFTDGTKEEFSEKSLGYLVKDAPLKPDVYKEVIAYNVHLDVLEVLNKYNLKTGEFEYIIQKMRQDLLDKKINASQDIINGIQEDLFSN